MEIVRRIYADKVEDIDVMNLGNHWTTDSEIFQQKKGAFSYTEAKGNVAFLIYAEINDENIDFQATQFSNERFPEEKEVITICNTSFDSIVVWNSETFEDEYEGPGNTGQRIDKWVENFHNGITD